MMKKIFIIILTLIMPLFVINNLQAQDNNGAPNFDIYIHVSAPQQCPSTGVAKGETSEIGNVSTAYNGTYQTYWLVWNSTLTYPQPVSAIVKTDPDDTGYYCYDKKTEILTGADWGYNFYLHLNWLAPVGGDEQ